MKPSLDEKAGELVVIWDDARSSRFPFVWLRDNCQCSSCYHHDAKCRRTDFLQLDLDSSPRSAQQGENGTIEILWTDDHKSVFEGDWLRKRSFGDSNSLAKLIRYEKRPKLWGAEMTNVLPTIPFESILADDVALYKWISALEETGICLLTGAPTEKGQLHRLAERVAYLRRNHYGDVFQIHSKVGPSNIAYTDGPVPMHTDTAYLHFIPGIQLLHCISQCTTEGGENMFTDGFKAAEDLRQECVDYFRLLSTTKLDYYDVGTDYIQFFMRARNYTIEVDSDGNVVKVTFSNHARDSVLPLPLDKVQPFYAALMTFYRIVRHPSNVLQLKMEPGNIICFHNHRVLHARTGFTMASGERHLEGGYMDWDEMRSKRRVLEEKLDLSDFSEYY